MKDSKTDKTLKIIIAVLLLLVIGVLGFTFGKLGQHKTTLPNTNSSQPDTTRQPNANQPVAATPQTQPTNTETAIEYMIINVPSSFDLGTGNISFVPVSVPQTAGVLNATLQQLFALQSNQDNSWNGYQYSSVEIVNDLARIYLTGSHYPAGDLSMVTMRNLVNAAAFQYPTVDAVAVFINGQNFDFCVDDQSNGEGGCPQTPKLWLDNK